MRTGGATKVSVIVTVYNLEKYVAATLASVLAQTHTNLEIVVVDDASTDGSLAAIEPFRERVTLVSLRKNSGVLLATLAGLREATGELVCFLDGDDLWSTHKVAQVVATFARDDRIVMVSHDYRFVDGDGDTVREEDATQDELRSLARAAQRERIDALMRRSICEFRGNVWLGSAWSIRRSALDLMAFEGWAAALPSPELTYQDHPLAIFLCLTSGGRFDYVDAKLLDYRVHAANHSGGFAMTPERMMRVLTKGRTTVAATKELVERRGGSLEARRMQRLRLAEFDFRIAAAEREWRAAVRAYVECARGLWGPGAALREGARAVSIAALGAERALRWKGRVARARHA